MKKEKEKRKEKDRKISERRIEEDRRERRREEMPEKGRGRKAQENAREERWFVDVCSMLQLVAGFLMVPVSIKFLLPPGSTYFTRVDAVTTGDPHGSSWQVEDATPHHLTV